MILGSHNSWSYLKPKRWWMRIFRFMARCQDVDIKTQYEEYGVRCFDLRIRYKNDKLRVVHGLTVYDITVQELLEQLDWLNNKKDVSIRLIHDIRNKRQQKKSNTRDFVDDCIALEQLYKHIKFWGGDNLYDKTNEYKFKNNPSCEEFYSSVKSPKIDDIYPRYYAKKYNKEIMKMGTDKDILLVDFVNIS